jgi:hypothetical protein
MPDKSAGGAPGLPCRPHLGCDGQEGGDLQRGELSQGQDERLHCRTWQLQGSQGSTGGEAAPGLVLAGGLTSGAAGG